MSVKGSGYRPYEIYQSNSDLKGVIDLIWSGTFSRGDTNLFKPLIDSLLGQDQYLVLKDFQSYVDCQQSVAETYSNKDQWTRMSILNVARMGRFSSDRSIREYSEKIWKVKQRTNA
jgi:starch phosphorylase